MSEIRDGGAGLIFNVGARRSGTYWLQQIVTAHSDVSAMPSETHLFSHGIAPLRDRFHHGDPASPEVGRTYVDPETMRERLRAVSDAAFEPHWKGRPFLAERTPLHVHHLPLIQELYPEARIVHIVRDGRAVSASLLRQSWGPDDAAEAAREWRGSVEAGREYGRSAAGYVEVRYEALVADPETEIDRLYLSLGLSREDRELAAALAAARLEVNTGPAGSRPERWREQLGEAELAAIERTAGATLGELGYGAEVERGDEMGRFWDGRAKENPYFFINNTLSYREPDLERFWASGEHDLDALLAALGARIEPGDES